MTVYVNGRPVDEWGHYADEIATERYDEHGGLMSAGEVRTDAYGKPFYGMDKYGRKLNSDGSVASYVYATPLPGGGSYPQSGVGYVPKYIAEKTKTPASTTPASTTPATPANSGMDGGTMMDLSSLFGGTGDAPVQRSNSFDDEMQKYLSLEAPQGPRSNSFDDALQKYLSLEAPKGQTAQLAENRFSGGLSKAEQRLQDLLNNPQALADSASYKFRVAQGQEALQRSMGAQGLLNSGNRLTELTKYGQDMGSQEYEAENARRMELLKSMMQGYGAEQGNNVNLLNVQQGSLDKQYETASDLFKARGTTLGDLYSREGAVNAAMYDTAADVYKARGTTLADLYSREGAANAAMYDTDVGAATERAKTLADLYRSNQQASTSRYATDVGAQTSKLPYEKGRIGDVPYWAAQNKLNIKYDQYGRPIMGG